MAASQDGDHNPYGLFFAPTAVVAPPVQSLTLTIWHHFPKNHIPITEATEVPVSPAPVVIQLITPRSPNLLNPHSTTVLQRFGDGAREEQQTKKKV